MTGGSSVDTLVTWLAPGRVRVSHRDGDAILDSVRDRFLILSPRDRTYRAMSLATWEERIAEALRLAGHADTTFTPARLEFEPSGDGGSVAGHSCQRYHLFTRRQAFPGEIEEVEQEIWVTQDFALPPETERAYRRVVANLDRIELDAEVERPPGVTLRTQLRRRSMQASRNEEVEATEVIAVERRLAPADVFAIPPGYAPADSAAANSHPHPGR
jgi:hypothetical protein